MKLVQGVNVLIVPQLWVAIGVAVIASYGYGVVKGASAADVTNVALVRNVDYTKSAAVAEGVNRILNTPASATPTQITPASTEPPNCEIVPCLALTFDDGPNPITTPQILSILEQNHIPASFFVVGSRVPGNEYLLQRMAADGDEIGNHGWDHPNFTKLTPEQMQQQIDLTQIAVEAAGVTVPTFFRPPYGAVNANVKSTVKLQFVLWNEDPRDWAADKPEQVKAVVEAAARPGGVIDLHDIYHVTTNALPAILADLKKQNYHFVTVSQIMNSQSRAQASAPSVYYGRIN
jgi:peptidoglycan/xylan/chitin deacetylase (PgdA/CDA1 family)